MHQLSTLIAEGDFFALGQSVQIKASGPDKVLEIAAARAADPAIDLDTVFPMAERAQIGQDYKVIAGFDPQLLNTRRSYTP